MDCNRPLRANCISKDNQLPSSASVKQLPPGLECESGLVRECFRSDVFILLHRYRGLLSDRQVENNSGMNFEYTSRM